jgi:hypothetical protein
MVITLHLVKPNNQLLPGYERALAAGWSPETSPEPQHGIREQHLREIRADPQGFLKRLTGTNRLVERLLDGRPVPPMREVVYWISDGEFSGVISLRSLPNSEVAKGLREPSSRRFASKGAPLRAQAPARHNAPR